MISKKGWHGFLLQGNDHYSLFDNVPCFQNDKGIFSDRKMND